MKSLVTDVFEFQFDKLLSRVTGVVPPDWCISPLPPFFPGASATSNIKDGGGSRHKGFLGVETGSRQAPRTPEADAKSSGSPANENSESELKYDWPEVKEQHLENLMFGDTVDLDLPMAEKCYDEIADFDSYSKLIDQQLTEYNQLMNEKMDIVIFRWVL